MLARQAQARRTLLLLAQCTQRRALVQRTLRVPPTSRSPQELPTTYLTTMCVDYQNLVMQMYFVCRNSSQLRGNLLAETKSFVHEPAVTSGIDRVTASCCSLVRDMLLVTMNPSPLRELVVVNARHESHCSWFFTVVTAPFTVQSTASMSNRPTHS